MQELTVLLDSVEKVRVFISNITLIDGEFDLVSGRYVVDAKSVMGIFSLDLCKPLSLKIHDPDNHPKAAAALKSLIVK